MRGKSRSKEIYQMCQHQYDLKLVMASNARYHHMAKELERLKDEEMRGHLLVYRGVCMNHTL